MIKIFRYEVKRLLFNKFFAGIAAVTLFFSWQILTGEIVRGISHTAPFSPWSFGYYLAQTLPLLCLGELFFLTFYTSRAERGVQEITLATPVDPRRYLAVRSCAVLLGTLFLAALVIGEGLAFYVWLFGWRAIAACAAPALLVLVPAFLFCLGTGWLAGRIHPAAVYVEMALLFLLAAAPLPPAAGFTLAGFFEGQPLTLGVLDPPFSAPGAVLLGRLVYALLGAAALAYCVTRANFRPLRGRG